MKVLCVLISGCRTLQRVLCQVCVVVCDLLALGVSAGTENVKCLRSAGFMSSQPKCREGNIIR